MPRPLVTDVKIAGRKSRRRARLPPACHHTASRRPDSPIAKEINQSGNCREAGENQPGAQQPFASPSPSRCRRASHNQYRRRMWRMKNAIGNGTSIGWMGCPSIFARLRGFETGVASSVSRLVRISITTIPNLDVIGNVARASAVPASRAAAARLHYRFRLGTACASAL